MLRSIKSVLSKLSPVGLVSIAIPVFFLALPDGIPFAFAGCGTPWQYVSSREWTLTTNTTCDAAGWITVDNTTTQVPSGCTNPAGGSGSCCALKVAYKITFAQGHCCCVFLQTFCSGLECPSLETQVCAGYPACVSASQLETTN